MVGNSAGKPPARSATRAILSAGCAVWLLSAAPASAKPVQFDIPAQDLAAALNKFGLQSGREIAYTPDVLGAKRSVAVKGDLEPQAALASMLAGSGLIFRETNGKITIVPGGAPGPKRAGVELSPATQTVQPTATATATATAAGTDYRTQEIIVTANKRRQSLLDVAANVSALGSDRLDKMSAVKIADYAAFVPGLQVQPSTSAGLQTIVLRGITPLGVSSTTATYVDEVPVGSAGNKANGSVLPPDIDPGELERVEVLQGPQGTLYGSSSLGGLIKYVTRKPDLIGFQGYASADLYSVSHGGIGTELRAGATAPIVQEKLAFSIAGHYRWNPGYIDDVHLDGSDANSSRTKGVHGALRWIPTDGWSVLLNAQFSRVSGDANNTIRINPVTRRPIYDEYATFHVAHTPVRNDLDLYSAQIEHDFGGATLTSVTAFSRSKAQNNADASLSPLRNLLALTAEQGIQAVTPVNVRRWTQEARLASASNGKFEWLVGVFYQGEDSTNTDYYDAVDGSGRVLVLPAPRNPVYLLASTNSINELAGFGNASLYLMPNLWVTGGYRYSRIETDDESLRSGYLSSPATPTARTSTRYTSKDTKSTYLLSISWKPANDLLLYGRAASGYRPGGTRSLPAGAPASFSTSYMSDGLWNYEVGVKGSWLNNRIVATFDGFWIDWKDIQQQFIVNGFSVIGNGGKARSRGVEGSLAVEPVTGLTINASFTYSDSVFAQANPALNLSDGQRIPFVSRWTGGLAAEYAAPLVARWNGFVGGDFKYKSSAFGFDRFKYDGYSLFGAHVGAELDQLRISLYATNLANQRRIVAGNSSATQNPFEALFTEPRIIGISVRTKF